jgi:hypothetical protein
MIGIFLLEKNIDGFAGESCGPCRQWPARVPMLLSISEIIGAAVTESFAQPGLIGFWIVCE